MGIMSATLRLESYKTGENKAVINAAIDKGLISLYVMNHLANQDMDKSDYYQEHRLQVVYTCVLSALSAEYQDEALLNMEHDGLKTFVHNTRMKTSMLKASQDYEEPRLTEMLE